MLKSVSIALLSALTVFCTPLAAQQARYSNVVKCTENACTLMSETLDFEFVVDPADVGKFGAFYIAVFTNADRRVFLQPSGFVYSGTAYDYHTISNALPSAYRVKYSWGEPNIADLSSICGMMERNNAGTLGEVWMGYGAVQPEDEQRIALWKSIAVKDKPEQHFRIVASFEDGMRHKKYTRAFTFECTLWGGNKTRFVPYINYPYPVRDPEYVE